MKHIETFNVKVLLSATPLLSVTPSLSVKLLLSVAPSLSVKFLLSVKFCYMVRFRFNNTSPSSERGPRFLIVGRKRVSAYDLWQCPCYRLWQPNKIYISVE